MTNTNTLNKRPPSTPTERKLLLILWVCHYGETVGKVQVQILPLIRHLIYIYVYKSAYIDFGMIKWFPRWPKNCPAVTVVPPLESDPSLWPSLAAGELLPPSPEYFRQAFFMDRELFYSYFASAASTTAKMRKKRWRLNHFFSQTPLDYTSSWWETCSILMTPGADCCLLQLFHRRIRAIRARQHLSYIPDKSDLRWTNLPE